PHWSHKVRSTPPGGPSPPGDFLSTPNPALNQPSPKRPHPPGLPEGCALRLDATGKPSSVRRLVSDPLLDGGFVDQTFAPGQSFLCPHGCPYDEEQTLPAPYPSPLVGQT